MVKNMSIAKDHSSLQVGAALLGASLGAVGALLIEPVALVAGTALAAAAIIMRIVDRDKDSQAASSGSGETPSDSEKPRAAVR